MLNDTDYPGWVALVDGQPAKVLNANYMFRGVLLEAGKHMIQFVYQPQSFLIGSWISGAAVLAMLAFGGYKRFV